MDYVIEARRHVAELQNAVRDIDRVLHQIDLAGDKPELETLRRLLTGNRETYLAWIDETEDAIRRLVALRAEVKACRVAAAAC